MNADLMEEDKKSQNVKEDIGAFESKLKSRIRQRIMSDVHP